MRRSLGYGFPVHTFNYEVHEMLKSFLTPPTSAALSTPTFVRRTMRNMSPLTFWRCYARSMKATGIALNLPGARRNRTRILILSDHGNNHAGPPASRDSGISEKAGYRVAESIRSPKDVVLPTAGIESWVEIHNSPSETERLALLLTGLKAWIY